MPLINETAQWYRAAWKCPDCGRRPRLRLSAAMLALAWTSEPDTVLLNYECHGQGCACVFPLSALTVTRAEPDATAKSAA
jgi:hypothetical protein